MATIDEIALAIDKLRKTNLANRNLTDEVAALFSSLRGELDENLPARTRMEIAEIIEQILTDESDAKLRKKFERLAEIIRNANGDINADTIKTKMIF